MTNFDSYKDRLLNNINKNWYDENWYDEKIYEKLYIIDVTHLQGTDDYKAEPSSNDNVIIDVIN